MKWKAATSGEELFLFVREDVLPVLPSSQHAWAGVQSVLSAVGGSPDFSAYFRGAIAIHAVRRLISHCAGETDGAAASTHVKVVSRFASEEVFPGLEADLLARLARLVVKATSVSDRDITRATRMRVLRGLEDVRCYLCGRRLDAGTTDNNHAAFLTIDHVWPSSIGGESDDDNLLPACIVCQKKKAGGASWEWLNIHNLVWSSSPSADIAERVDRQVRIARYFSHVTELACARRCSLKSVLVELGKMMFPATFARTGQPATFFDLQTWEPQ